MLIFNREKLASAVIDKEMSNTIERFLDTPPDSIGFKLDSKNFIVRTPISTLSPLGWVHVYRSEVGKIDCGLRYENKNGIMKTPLIFLTPPPSQWASTYPLLDPEAAPLKTSLVLPALHAFLLE